MHPAAATNEPAHDAHGLRTGGRALFVAQGVKFAVRALSAMLLARLLTPDDYGIFGMAAAVHGVLNMVRDLGTGAAVHQPGLTRERFDALCRFGALGGLALGVLCAAAGSAAADFYAEPRLPAILAGLALCLPLAGATAPLQSLLYREQRIAAAAKIDAVALAVGCAVGLATAAAGARVWALVAMAVTNELVALALVWRVSPWRPRWRGGAMPWRSLLTFGAQISGHSVAGFLARTCDQIALGRSAGAAALGVYGRGVQATALPMQFSVAPFTGWIIASLVRVQSDPAAYRAVFRSALNGLAHLTLPLAAGCVAAPDVVVGLLFGARWMEAVPVVRWLGLGLAVQPWLFAHIWLSISTGRTRRLLGLSLLMLAIFLTATVAARHHGIAAMAAAVAAASVASSAITLGFALAASPARTADVVAAGWRPWVLHGGLATVLAGVHRWLPANQPWPVMAGGLVAVGAAYGAVALALWPAARAECRGHFLWQRGGNPPVPVSANPEP
jgi:O-antigen/teichoic acid export membrane protein